MTPARARALLKAMRGGRVLVLGDVMLDEFIWGDVARISPEAPVPVVQVTGHDFHLGGAGNVAANVRSLEGSAVLAGVIGEDAAGEHVRSALARAGVEPLLLVASGGRPTTVKTRIIAHHQQVVRADREHTGEISSRLQSLLYDSAKRALGACQALVVSDYQKGVVTASLMQRLLPLARRRHIPVLVDPKVGHFARYRRATLVTPNQLEAEQATGLPIRSPGDLLAVGRRILSMLGGEAVLITRGERGMSLFERGRRPTHIPTAAREVFDVTGAGDTVIATLALALSAGARLAEAAVLANYAAGVVVGKLGTAQAMPDEVLAAVERPVPPKAPASP